MNALDQQTVKVIKHKRTEEDFKKGIIKYLELCSKHTFKDSNGSYFWIRISEDKLTYTTTYISYKEPTVRNKNTKLIEDSIKYEGVENVKCLLKQRLYNDDSYKAIKRTKPVRKFVEGIAGIHIPEQFLQKTV